MAAVAPDRCNGCKYFEANACWVACPTSLPNPLTGEDELRREVPANSTDLACVDFFPRAH